MSGQDSTFRAFAPPETGEWGEKQARRRAAGPPPDSYNLPTFRYYSADAAEKVFRESDEVCDCCETRQGHIYTGPFYFPRPPHQVDLCASCIADGSAAAKFAGSFNDVIVEFDGTIIDAEAARVPPAILDEIAARTPGYESWQGNSWAFHCGDAAVFHGDASAEVVASASRATIEHWEHCNPGQSWPQLMDRYRPRGGLSVYHFICPHCSLDLFLYDFD